MSLGHLIVMRTRIHLTEDLPHKCHSISVQGDVIPDLLQWRIDPLRTVCHAL